MQTSFRRNWDFKSLRSAELLPVLQGSACSNVANASPLRPASTTFATNDLYPQNHSAFCYRRFDDVLSGPQRDHRGDVPSGRQAQWDLRQGAALVVGSGALG